MKLKEKLNLRNLVILVFCIWGAHGLVGNIKNGDIHIKAITFSRVNEPIFFWFFIVFGFFGIFCLLYIVFFGTTENDEDI
ncbi:hypothetical protein [Arsukibacterium sp.]|uniref:hypothetical protein n=1 Tax=Arsukibacterium sp. TaxID=1977258 RepID=UPI00299F3401|nr:hypothetical protein [Arsukibacterium sp.]MDX1539284.1 hypothetical protein [Arsukibacterium sp.]